MPDQDLQSWPPSAGGEACQKQLRTFGALDTSALSAAASVYPITLPSPSPPPFTCNLHSLFPSPFPSPSLSALHNSFHTHRHHQHLQRLFLLTHDRKRGGGDVRRRQAALHELLGIRPVLDVDVRERHGTNLEVPIQQAVQGEELKHVRGESTDRAILDRDESAVILGQLSNENSIQRFAETGVSHRDADAALAKHLCSFQTPVDADPVP
mmetsp:Transcript_26154/g.41952  ORF Transcript_26154/g.41952 Transcript_26154/m.41952 type:complete len:210 (-) Transcript_26154:685-1314(-)